MPAGSMYVRQVMDATEHKEVPTEGQMDNGYGLECELKRILSHRGCLIHETMGKASSTITKEINDVHTSRYMMALHVSRGTS